MDIRSYIYSKYYSLRVKLGNYLLSLGERILPKEGRGEQYICPTEVLNIASKQQDPDDYHKPYTTETKDIYLHYIINGEILKGMDAKLVRRIVANQKSIKIPELESRSARISQISNIAAKLDKACRDIRKAKEDIELDKFEEYTNIGRVFEMLDRVSSGTDSVSISGISISKSKLKKELLHMHEYSILALSHSLAAMGQEQILEINNETGLIYVKVLFYILVRRLQSLPDHIFRESTEAAQEVIRNDLHPYSLSPADAVMKELSEWLIPTSSIRDLTDSIRDLLDWTAYSSIGEPVEGAGSSNNPLVGLSDPPKGDEDV